MTGIFLLAATDEIVIQPTLRIYPAGSGTTETIPIGAKYVSIELWGGGGPGGNGTGSGCAAESGGGGGAGGYCYLATFFVAYMNGATFVFTVGQGAASGLVGTASSVTPGTVSGFSAMTANGGNPGSNQTAGTGGTATGTNSGQVNTTGAPGTNGSLTGPGGAPGAGTTGNIVGDGSPYGAGNYGGSSGAGHPGLTGKNGAVVFYYQ
jgi:hypothetical protein